MEHTLDLHGMAALEYILSRFGHPLAEHYDARLDRVGFILHEGDDRRARVGYWPRQVAPVELRRIAAASRAAKGALDVAAMEDTAAAIADGPRPAGLQCVICGPGMCVLVEINVDDLRRPTAAPPTNDDLAELFDQCLTQGSASMALLGVRAALEEQRGVPVAELAALVRVIEDEWSDVDAVLAAAARAQVATEGDLVSAAGQRARGFLNMLVEATERRRPGAVNAPGGAA